MNDFFLQLETAAPKIIKRKNQNPVTSGAFRNLVKHQILNAETEAQTILQTARENADKLKIAAEQEAETIRQNSYLAGRESAESELLENLLEIKEQRTQVLRTIEEDMLKLAVKLAEKIIGRELGNADGAARTDIVLNALRAARQQEMLTVRINAGDLPTLERMRDEKTNIFGRGQLIDFIADQTVADGGCIIESQSGTIDARIETQLRILENALLERAANSE